MPTWTQGSEPIVTGPKIGSSWLATCGMNERTVGDGGPRSPAHSSNDLCLRSFYGCDRPSDFGCTTPFIAVSNGALIEN